MVNMNTKRGRSCLPIAGLGLGLLALTGCQTWVPGAALTLPSPHYLEHPPQYIPPSPFFPFIREEATQLAISARVAEPAVAAPLPPAVPGPLPPGGGRPVLPPPGPGGP
jgi:hypothetical protein